MPYLTAADANPDLKGIAKVSRIYGALRPEGLRLRQFSLLTPTRFPAPIRAENGLSHGFIGSI